MTVAHVVRRHLARVDLLSRFKQGWVHLDEEVRRQLADAETSLEDFVRNPSVMGSARDILWMDRRLQRRAQHEFWEMLTAGKTWVQYILQVKKIPPGMAKKVEFAARPFLATARVPNKIAKWILTNAKYYQFLIGANNWAEKSLEDDSEQIFEIGPFTVHNTIQATGPKLAQTQALIEKANRLMQKARLPGFKQALYGEVFIVGRLHQPRTLAWYYPSKDIIYIRPHLKVSRTEIHDFIHEIGHRYWRKFVPSAVKSKWMGHHSSLQFKRPTMDKVVLPEVGDVFPFPVAGMKRGGPPVVTESVPGSHVVIETKSKKARISFSQLRSFLAQRSKRSVYPTPYSSTDAEEHFCEALAMYIQGILPPEHAEAFEEIVIKKQEVEEGVLRVARRFLLVENNNG